MSPAAAKAMNTGSESRAVEAESSRRKQRLRGREGADTSRAERFREEQTSRKQQLREQTTAAIERADKTRAVNEQTNKMRTTNEQARQNSSE